MSKYDALIQTRLDSKIREKFNELAKDAKRKPADFLRIMIEEAVEAADKRPGRRSLALASK